MSDTPWQTRSALPLAPEGVSVRRQRLFYGWWVVLVSAIGIFWGVPVTVYSFSVFLKPLMQEFHAGRAAISFGFTVLLFVAALCAPLYGWLVDRYGARIVILPATVLSATVLLANKAFAANLFRFYFFFATLGFLLQGQGPVPYGHLISHWFDRRRGLALGLTMLGIGAGAVVMPSLAQRLVTGFGWSMAYSILGACALLIALPATAAFLREKPQDLGLLPDAAPLRKSPAESETPRGFLARDAWRSGTFWVLTCAFVLVSASVQGCLVHLAAMLSDRGINAQTAALGSSVIGAAVLLARVGTGFLLDRVSGPLLAAASFVSAGFGIGLFLLGGTWLAFPAAFLVGVGLGAEVDLIPFLTSRYFGLRAFGKIYSSVFAAFALAGALGPLIMGAAFDRTGTYRGALAAFSIATLLAAVLIARLGPYRYQPEAASNLNP